MVIAHSASAMPQRVSTPHLTVLVFNRFGVQIA
jgi:hypothetical protein